MKDAVIPSHMCICGNELNGSLPTDKDYQQPHEGDVSICGYCGRLWLFNKDLTQRQPEPHEWEDIKKNTNAWGEVSRIMEIIKSRKKIQ